MPNRDFSQVAQGPTTPDGPGVDEIRADLYGSSSVGTHALREIRRTAGIRSEVRKALPPQIDPVAGEPVRICASGRTERPPAPSA
ncbi:hypothetical protein OHT52_06310 [Streptomyces sp. NBC_00247]|uniref:hypothetical protein n=1 Tax=Streptomyces sp. NBC_00247 TaxID=2975689 RepID=UPI002E285A30|nr:hypothetical protein [Streptomyces sp. NBC_00247]